MSTNKQQFNIYLPTDLVREIKHRSIDEQLSMSDWVEHVLRSYLQGKTSPYIGISRKEKVELIAPVKFVRGLTLQPMIHVHNLAQAVAFYQTLGFLVEFQSRDGDWAQLRLGSAEVSLLAHPPSEDDERVELNLSSDESLAVVESRLREAGVTIIRPASDEGFGAQLKIQDADGYVVKINNFDPPLFG